MRIEDHPRFEGRNSLVEVACTLQRIRAGDASVVRAAGSVTLCRAVDQSGEPAGSFEEWRGTWEAAIQFRGGGSG